MFKQYWEKASTPIILPQPTIMKMVHQALPGKKSISSSIISGGCANLNIKINSDHDTYILRVYLRDKNAAKHEQTISRLLSPNLPVPLIYYIGNHDNYRFALTSFIEGITLRDLLLSDRSYNLSSIMYDVGSTLAKVATYDHPHQNNISPDYRAFVHSCISHENTKATLGTHNNAQLKAYITKYDHLFPAQHANTLVHGDFDPANILVHTYNNQWKVSGVLDWEFSFSGSMLWDIASMLRYAHKMPLDFESSFLLGLTDHNVRLPEHWRITINLLNLLSLLDILTRTNQQSRPYKCQDIRCLIEHIIKNI